MTIILVVSGRPYTSTITVFSTLKSILDAFKCFPIATHRGVSRRFLAADAEKDIPARNFSPPPPWIELECIVQTFSFSK